METKYVQIDYYGALEAKKQLLTSELNFLHILKKLNAYRIFRKKEFAEKNKLKTQITFLRDKFNALRSTFPEQEIKIKIKKELKENEDKDIQEELEEIKRRLEKLQ